MRVKKFVFKSFQRLLDEVGQALTTYLRSGYLEMKSQKSKKVKVYDVLNVEKSSRFSTLGGLVAHNCLGLSYLMSKYGLAIKLTADTGRAWTEDEAQGQIDTFYNTFSDLKIFQDEIIQTYLEDGYIRIPDGWYVWGDNENHRSVNNVPIQGLGAAIMRKAVELAMDKGIYVCMTLHDALYIEYPVGQEWQIKTLADCMVEAFAFYFPEDQKPIARKIKLDPFAWSPDYDKDSAIHVDGWEVECSNLYIDSRATKEYEKFKQYFDLPIEDGL